MISLDQITFYQVPRFLLYKLFILLLSTARKLTHRIDNWLDSGLFSHFVDHVGEPFVKD